MKIINSEFTVITIGIFFVILGFIIRYKINKRRFNRKALGGLQHFKNYEQAWLVTLIERILMVLSFIIIITGLVFSLAVVIF
jgi:ABC-type transport system involved in cytochrome c biogenesis permease subunit